jgi:phenylacetate-CoA ligase
MRISYGSERLRALYDRTPVAVQDALTTAYGYGLSAKTRRGVYKETLASLQETQWWDEDRIVEQRDTRCSAFMRQAACDSPFWSDQFAAAGLSPDVVGVGSLHSLPVLLKEQVRLNVERMLSRPWATGARKGIPVHTSGTTGTGLHMTVSRESWQRESAFRDLHRSWGGFRAGDSVATIAGHPVVPAKSMDPPFWRRNCAFNQTLFSSQHMTRATLPAYLTELRRLEPALIHGYPSSLYVIASFWLESGEERIRPKSVFSHSETLFDWQRAAIEDAFECKVFNWYGNTEMTANIVECEHDRLHVKNEYSLVEFLRADGTRADAGEYARIVGTAFGNDATPLIRYDTGDMAILSAESCECGRPGPIVDRVLGRQDDIFVTPDGRMLGCLDLVFTDALNVVEAQLIQDQPDLVLARIVKREGYSTEDEARIATEMRSYLGNSVRLSFDYVDRIPREGNGKFRFAISRVPLPIAATQSVAAERGPQEDGSPA